MTNQIATIAPATAMANLERHAEQARGAYASNTERALRADTAIWAAWCGERGLISVPAPPEVVAAFVDNVAEARAPATVRRYVSSIASLHRAAKAQNPCDALVVKLALKRMHRAKGRAQVQAAPLNRPAVDKMLATAGEGLRGLRNRALLAVAYDSLCRRSELVALQVDDIEANIDGSGTVLVRRSKTDAEGEGMIRFLAADTMRHVTAWCAAAGITDSVLFRSVRKADRVRGALTPGEVARVFKEMADGAGVGDAKISGHSSRVGAAQDMVGMGVDLASVMRSGGWKTPEMVGRYTARLDARRSGAAKLAIMQNRA